MKQLQELIDRLTANSAAAMTIWNLDDQDPKTRIVISNATKNKIETNYGTFEEFFATLKAQGITNLRVFGRRRNGSTYIPQGEPFDIEIEGGQEKPAMDPGQPKPAAPENQPAPAIPAIPQPDFSALAGPGLNAGLNAAMYHAMDYPRLQGEHSAYKMENERLKEELRTLREDAIRGENSEKKTASQHEFLGTLAGHAPQILTALGALGLSIGNNKAAQVQPEPAALQGDALSPTQLQAARELAQLDDDTVSTLMLIAQNCNNSEFANEILEVLRKHQLLAA